MKLNWAPLIPLLLAQSSPGSDATPNRAIKPATPLSDLIDHVQEAPTAANAKLLLDAFPDAELGVITHGWPDGGSPGSVNTVKLDIDMTKLADGRWMVLACADPAAYKARFGGHCDTRVKGRVLAQAADSIPHCDGISVNSATGERHFVVDMEQIRRILRKPQ